MKTAELVNSFKPNFDLKECEKLGYDCAKNGANEDNCDFRIFGSVEGKEAWERGKKKYELKKKLGEIK